MDNVSLSLKHRMIERQKDFSRKDIVVKLEGKEAKAYLQRVAGLLIGISEKLEDHPYVNEYLTRLSVCLKFLADMSLVKRMEWNGKKFESSRFMRIGIDTRTGFPIWEDIETEIDYYRNIMERGGSVEKFKENILRNPEQDPDYYRLYQDVFAEKISKLGLPPMPEQRWWDSHGNSKWGNDFLNFFGVNGLKKADCYEETFWRGRRLKPMMKEILENRVCNDASFMQSQIKEALGITTGITTISIFLNNKFTKNQIEEVPSENEGIFARITDSNGALWFMEVDG